MPSNLPGNVAMKVESKYLESPPIYEDSGKFGFHGYSMRPRLRGHGEGVRRVREVTLIIGEFDFF